MKEVAQSGFGLSRGWAVLVEAAFYVKSEKFAICNLDADVWGGSFVNSYVSLDLKCPTKLSSLTAKQSTWFWRMCWTIRPWGFFIPPDTLKVKSVLGLWVLAGAAFVYVIVSLCVHAPLGVV